MAKPIRETPVLRGKDAKKFLSEIKKNEHRKVSAADYQKAKKNYEEIIKDAKI